ncbi:MAG: geranylgeranyl reductase family protein [Flavobacteriales bacterium]
MTHRFDVMIIGAGPAGTSAALSLHNSGLSVALIDKSEFPRDKICGDALSPDVVNQLKMLPFDVSELFDQFQEKIWCKAVRFVAPNYKHADLSLNKQEITGYVSPRLDFDQFLFNQAVKSDAITAFNGSGVKTIARENQTVVATLENGTRIEAEIVLGADGAHSIVAREFTDWGVDKNHHCAGLRIYYENVSGFSNDNAVELHFYKELLPGYFWIFPLPGNRANVGLGMLSAHIAKRKPNIKKMLMDIIENHPNVKDRFKNASALEDIKGFGLPLGSKKRNISGERFLLLGDAAGLINPLSGEGIANAIRSGRVAADHLKRAFESENFSASFNKEYDREIYRRLWGELQLNYWLQLTMRRPWLTNFIVTRAIGNKSIQEMVLSGFDIDKIRSRMSRPGFYFKIFTGK